MRFAVPSDTGTPKVRLDAVVAGNELDPNVKSPLISTLKSLVLKSRFTSAAIVPPLRVSTLVVLTPPKAFVPLTTKVPALMVTPPPFVAFPPRANTPSPFLIYPLVA